MEKVLTSVKEACLYVGIVFCWHVGQRCGSSFVEALEDWFEDHHFFEPLRLSFQGEFHLSSRSSLLRREEETAPCWRARYRCALRLAGHQSPRQIVRAGTAWVSLCLLLAERFLWKCLAVTK